MFTAIYQILSRAISAQVARADNAMFERERKRREAYLSQATDLVHLEYLERQYDRSATRSNAVFAGFTA